ncbi:MAG: YfiT family bacillithiol transferase [Gemmatimonadales bacterium]
MTEDLRYPVGKFAMPTEPGANDVARWRMDLAELPATLRIAVAGLSNAQLDTPYRDAGWTVRQTVHHLADSHLNAYCRFRIALTEETPTIKPYLEARWAELPDARTLSLAPSLEILDGLHARWLALIDTMTPEQWRRAVVHPEHQRSMTLTHLAALYAWHGRHHTAHIANLRLRCGWSP